MGGKDSSDGRSGASRWLGPMWPLPSRAVAPASGTRSGVKRHAFRSDPIGTARTDLALVGALDVTHVEQNELLTPCHSTWLRLASMRPPASRPRMPIEAGYIGVCHSDLLQ